MSQTDSEILFRELQKYVPGSEEFRHVLETSLGRMALAFTHRLLPGKLILVRGALSPLAYSYSETGMFAYGSNPNWFRKISEEYLGTVKFSKITLVPEGSILIVNSASGEIEADYVFTPKCRESDLYFTNSSVYKNFTLSDKRALNKMAYRTVVPSSLKTPPRPVTVEGYKEIAPARVSYEDGMLFDDYFLSGQTSVPVSPECDEGRVSLEHVERLCDAYPVFNESLYGYLLGAEDEEDLESRYTESIVEAFNVGVLKSDSFAKLGIPEPLGSTVR